MELESNICQLVQKSIDLSLRDNHLQDSHMQDNFKIQPLSILQTPSTIAPLAKTPKARGRKKGSKIKTKIVASIQTTLDNSFIVMRISTRRTRCSHCPQ